MIKHFSSMLLLVLAVVLPALGGSALAKGGKTTYRESEEYPIFYGEADGTVVALCLPDDPARDGSYLTLYLKRPDGKVLDLRGDIIGDGRHVVARSLDFAGGDYSYVRIRNGSRDYIAYSGVGGSGGDGDEAEPVAGFAVEENGALVEHFDMSDTFTSELGPDLFGMLELALDAYEFALPDTEATRHMRLLGETLAGRIEEARANGQRALIRSEGIGTLSGKPCRFYSLGTSAGDRYTALDHYAVDGSGKIYVMDDDGERKYKPVSAVVRTGAVAADRPSWEGVYAGEKGTLTIERFRASSAHGHTFRFAFTSVDGSEIGAGSATVDVNVASSFELDFIRNGNSIRVVHIPGVEVSPEEEWSAGCAGMYTRR